MIEIPKLEEDYMWREGGSCEIGEVVLRGKDEMITDAQAAEVIRRADAHEGLVKHIEALKAVCENYIPADKMDEANNEVILLSKGIREEIGRKLLAKQALKDVK